MRTNGSIKQLGEVIRFANGKSIKPGGTGQYPVYGSNGIIGQCDEHQYENGIIIGRVGAYCGSVVYCPERFWASDNTLIAFPCSNEFDVQFLFYLLKGAELRQYAGGAAQPLVTQSVLKQVPVRVPPLPIQRRIANILSTYDELIENNQRRIKILEEMARALYREWFVNFRFPGHEKVPLVASPLGDIPRGWFRPFSEVVFFQEGPGLRKWQWTTLGMKVINVTNILENGTLDVSNTARHISLDEFKTTYKHFAVDPNDIVIASSGNTYGKIAKVRKYDLPLMMNTSVIRFAPKNRQTLDPMFLEYFLKSDVFKQQIESFVIGSAQPNFGPTHLKQMVILYPALEVQQKFGVFAGALDEEIKVLLQQIQNLRRTRDLMLPRLMAGQVELTTEKGN